MVKSKKIKRILVVDDQEVARRAISSVMQRHGHVDTAADGHTALQQYVTATEDGWFYDLVCLDITMPGLLNGYQVVRCIRAHEVKLGLAEHVPVVMISSHTDLAAYAKEMELPGADEYIVKPFSHSHLDEVAQRFLN